MELHDAEFFGANLSNANFTEAILYAQGLNRVSMTGADLTRANWSYTTCPEGTSSDMNNGTCCGHLNVADRTTICE
jgi:uncharacterized protein YjbI with pentapeptide repeats